LSLNLPPADKFVLPVPVLLLRAIAFKTSGCYFGQIVSSNRGAVNLNFVNGQLAQQQAQKAALISTLYNK